LQEFGSSRNFGGEVLSPGERRHFQLRRKLVELSKERLGDRHAVA
jgi:hypothetical protein